jgi:hypothetical protein
MAKGNYARKKEKKKVKKSVIAKRNSKITTARAMYDNQLIGSNPTGISGGY